MPPIRRGLIRNVALVLALMMFAAPAFSWNFSGHWVIAAIAYDRLTPAARAKVDDLIRRHPDYQKFAANGPADPAALARHSYIRAASWPDQIRGDGRFYDESKADAKPTPVLAGFPDMGRHETWHYHDHPYSPDGTPAEEQAPPDAKSELPRLIREIAGRDLELASYDLVWLTHVLGDVHQPLHSTSRFLKSQPEGDQGGNLVFLGPDARLLHSLWDNAATDRDLTDERIDATVSEFTTLHPVAEYPGLISTESSTGFFTVASTEVDRWLQESFSFIDKEVYTFGNDTGTKEKPLPLPDGYLANAKRIAVARVTQAGYRLAAVLNAQLQ